LIRSLLKYLRLPSKTLSKIGLVLASIIIVGGLSAWTWSDFSDVLADAETIVSSTSLAMDDVARSSLQAVDGVLESIVNRIEKEGIGSLATESQRENLERFAKRLPGTRAIYVTDDTGNIIVSVPSLQSPINLSSREWFKSLRDEKHWSLRVEPDVGRAVKRDTADNLFFPIARSIRGPQGAFLGAVEIGVELAFFAHVFQALDAGFRLDVRSEAKLGLYRTKDGAVVARFPITEDLLGETVAPSPYFSLLANSEGQSWVGWTRSRGERLLVSARSLRGWPLIVSVSLPESEVYSVAWSRLLWRSLIAAMAIAALSLLAVLVDSQAKREAVLVAELEHRVKNTLTVVAAVIERAREDTRSIDQFVSSIRDRIQSMARTQTLLGESRSRSVSLADLVRVELRPYTTATNTDVDGPVVYLLPAASHALAMVVHELATNAAKYGALSQPGGHVSVRWRQTADPLSAPMLRIEWRESGGPQVTAPAREGYGSSVIRDLLAYELGGSADLVFAADGVRCTIKLPANTETVV
jgi:two-component sensor histidine kinase